MKESESDSMAKPNRRGWWERTGGAYACWFYGGHWLPRKERSGRCVLCGIDIVNGRRIRPWLHTHVEGEDG